MLGKCMENKGVSWKRTGRQRPACTDRKLCHCASTLSLPAQEDGTCLGSKNKESKSEEERGMGMFAEEGLVSFIGNPRRVFQWMAVFTEKPWKAGDSGGRGIGGGMKCEGVAGS